MSCCSVSSNSFWQIAPKVVGAALVVGGIFAVLAGHNVLPKKVTVMSGALGKSVGAVSIVAGYYFALFSTPEKSRRKCLFRCGEMLQKPFLSQAEGTTAVITGRRNVSSITRMATLPLAPLTGLLALVGAACREQAMGPRPKWIGKQGQGRMAGDQIKVATYNLGLMPPYIANINRLRPSSERVVEVLDNLPECDLICFQEAFDRHASIRLVEGLKERFGTVVYDVGETELGFGSGLVIATHFTVKDIEYERFTVSGGEDVFANKGVLGLTLNLENERVAHFFGTHLQAKEGERFDRIRSTQLACISAMASKREGLAILAGDLNMTGQVDVVGFTDLNPDQGTWYQQNATWNTDQWDREVSTTNYDHVLVRGGRGEIEVLDLTPEGSRSGSSDHLPLMATITL